jgi:RND family efflux transporter MFP subunit
MTASFLRTGGPFGLLALGILLMPASGYGQSNLRPVRVAQAEFAPLPVSVELVGTIRARNESELSTQVEGLVDLLKVDVGSHVEAGDVLLQLDATLADIRRGQTAEALKAAEAELAEARRRLEEIRSLVENGGISASELETRKSQVQIRAAAVARLELVLREELEILERHTLRAPFSGVVNERYAQIGEWVSPGVPVFELVETGFRTFDIQAPQTLFTQISETTRADVRIDLAPDQTFPAQITAIVPAKNTSTRTFLIRLEMDAPERLLLPGASGRARLYVGGDAKRISVPVDALVRQPDGSFVVWVLSDNGAQPEAEMRRVEVGERAEDRMEILTGVQAGDRVIVRGNENLVPGQALQVIDNEGPET